MERQLATMTPEQAEAARIAVFQPGMVGPVHLDELTYRLTPRACLSVPPASAPRLPDAALDEPEPARRRMDLLEPSQLGIPHQVLIGERGLANGMVEYRKRGAESTEHELDGIETFIAEQLAETSG